MAKKCARTFSIVVEKGKKSILDVGHLLPDALPRSVRCDSNTPAGPAHPPSVRIVPASCLLTRLVRVAAAMAAVRGFFARFPDP